MAVKEAKARIKINKLLEISGWRFFDDENGLANIVLEPTVKLTKTRIDALGENFEMTANGFIDFLLLDAQGFPLIVLEAKAEDKTPLIGKEQARTYAKSQNCRFVILSNGNLHYFWDLNQGNPIIITRFPTPDSIKGFQFFQPRPDKLVNELVEKDYIALTQMPTYTNDPGWTNGIETSAIIKRNRLCFMREYQQRAVHSLQQAVKEGKTRFLFEMATGTGKTLIAAAVIKLFLRTSNARRVLFLVDRLELEDQAHKTFVFLLKNDFSSLIYKERRDDWRKSEIVVTTIQSLLFNNKYESLFSPTDFDLVISDEAHRSIGGNARAVFEYFVGYKLGLTATPRDYLKITDQTNPIPRDPREMERRLLLDTYRTFGCDSGDPTFRYSLLDGVRDGFLINPLVVDARTDITTKLLSDEGYPISVVTDEEDFEQTFYQRDFEKRFFSEDTNRVFCETLLNNALRDPISREIGKTLVFAVSQYHAAKITQILNEIADRIFPGKYQSDFAVQITSLIPYSQQYTINFANNNLMGSANFLDSYKTSKARVCVTVGMMTTGYDCPDILNLAMMRPVFSPSDFVQIKGRGTRKHNFLDQLVDANLKPMVKESEKTRYMLFDFFANCEYFEEKFNYDKILHLPRRQASSDNGPEQPVSLLNKTYVSFRPDVLSTTTETQIGLEGMRIDRMFFDKFENRAKADAKLREMVEDGRTDLAAEYVKHNLFDKPNEFFNLETLRKAAAVDRHLTLWEVLEKVFGLIPGFKSKNELLDDEFQKFLLTCQPDNAEDIIPMKYYFKAYATDGTLRDIIDQKRFVDLNVNSTFNMGDFKAVPANWRDRIPEYVKDYVSLNQFI